jgi:hypothetical protein
VLFAEQQNDPDWATREQRIVPEHILISANALPTKLQKLEKQIRHRLGAAQVAMPFFLQAQRIAAGAAADINRASTIDARIQKTIEQEADREEWLVKHGIARKPRFPKDDNFETRVLRPSYPGDMGGPQINVADLLRNPDLARHVVGMAEEYERLIPHLPKLRIPHTVRLRLE